KTRIVCKLGSGFTNYHHSRQNSQEEVWAVDEREDRSRNTVRPQINTGEHGFKHGEITRKIIRVFYDVYNELGYGFLESVYEKSLQIALIEMGLQAVRQVDIP